MSVIAAEASTAPGQPTRRSPDPPRYARCIAYLRAYEPWAKPVKDRPVVGSRRLKAQCEYEYEKIKLKALYTLIPYVWIRGEASEMGVGVTATELRQRLEALKSQFGSETAFKRYIGKTGLTIQDLLSDIEQSVLSERIMQKLEKSSEQRQLTSAQRQQALRAFGVEYQAKWTSRTDCRPGYVVPICKQYHLSSVPYGLVPPAIPLTMSAE